MADYLQHSKATERKSVADFLRRIADGIEAGDWGADAPSVRAIRHSVTVPIYPEFGMQAGVAEVPSGAATVIISTLPNPIPLIVAAASRETR